MITGGVTAPAGIAGTRWPEAVSLTGKGPQKSERVVEWRAIGNVSCFG
jgi:hypothetical protein